MFKGDYVWRLEEKRAVLEKFKEFESKTGLRFFNPNATEFGMFRFNRTGDEAGSVWLYVTGVDVWETHKRVRVHEYVRQHCDGNEVRQNRSVDFGNARFLFYPLGYPTVIIESDAQVDRLVDHFERNYRHSAIDFRVDNATLSTDINILSRREQEDIRLNAPWREMVMDRVNAQLAERQRQREEAALRRCIDISEVIAPRERPSDEVVVTSWVVTLRPIMRRGDNAVRTVQEVFCDATEAYVFIRRAMLNEKATLSFSDTEMWRLSMIVADGVLGLAKPEAVEVEGDDASFLND